MVSFFRKGTVEVQLSLTEPPRKSRFFKNPEVRCYYKSVFDQWDTDQDGFISIDELKSLIAANECLEISNESLQYLYARFDRDRNNQLDFEEFFEMINHPKFKSTFRRITSRYLKFIEIPKYRQTVKIRRQLSNTGVYEDQFDFGWKKMFMIMISVIQVMLHYINKPKDELTDGPIVSALKFYPDKKIQIYRYLTSALVHNPKTQFHLYGNVVMQIIVGIPLELVHGWRVILLYLTGALAGSMTHYVLESDKALWGASPCVYSCFTAHIVTVLMNWKEMVHPIFHVIFFGIFVLCDVIYKSIEHYSGSRRDDASDASHLGGALVGFFLSAILLRNLIITRKEKIFSIIGGVLFIIYMFILFILNLTQTHL